jgi:hypothetical protein
MNELEFLTHFNANASNMMWLLGAGTSRSAGMPTASDLVWDLKVKYYCLQENQDIKSHDINNEAVKRRVQNYMDSRGYPTLWHNDEYSFYFELLFGKDRGAQQRYITEQLADSKISLNIGQRCLGGLIAMGITKVIFTSNFDNVIENAYSVVSGKSLTAYHLEGSYAALEALNSNNFPIYAKIHGDVRYQSIKNISEDLIDNDTKIKNCFLASVTRYGLVISGYSGRDQNVMNMLYDAILQHNAFPFGIFWTVTNISTVPDEVLKFIQTASDKGINAHIIETGSFDILLSKIWRQIPNKPVEIESKVKSSIRSVVNIPFPPVGKSFPVLRMNALPIVEVPNFCALLDVEPPLEYSDLKTLLRENRPNASMTKVDKIFGFGKEEEFAKALKDIKINKISKHDFGDAISLLVDNLQLRSFYERLLVTALCYNKPIKLINDRGFFISVDYRDKDNDIFSGLKNVLNTNYQGNIICNPLPGKVDVFWSEGISVKLEERNEKLFLMIRPEIIISPSNERMNCRDFIRNKRLKRYNKVTSLIIDEWIKILFGVVGKGLVECCCYEDSQYPAKFKINTRTLYSRKA